jgi:hypothetical protein
MVGELYPRLHATNESTLQWWTEAQLRQWANEALQQLARGAALFVRRDTSITTVNGTRTYALPARHIATIHAAYDGKPLEPTDRRGLDALDVAADSAVCGAGESPERWYEETLGAHAHIGVFPTPSAAATLALIFLQQPELFTSTSSTAPIPRVLKAFIEDYVLAEAWSADSDFAMPELAGHLRQKREMYLNVYRSYWGQGQ